jgi:hypothetical protein
MDMSPEGDADAQGETLSRRIVQVTEKKVQEIWKASSLDGLSLPSPNSTIIATIVQRRVSSWLSLWELVGNT